MEEIISKQEFDELMKIKGEVKGLVLKPPFTFVLKEEGEEGLKKLEDTITKLGYPIKHEEISEGNYYPVGLKAVTLTIMKRLFNYDDKKFRELGKFSAKLPMLVRFLFRYFISIDKLEKDPSVIKKIFPYHSLFSFGDLILSEVNKEKRYLILRLVGFDFHPLECQPMMGIFSVLFQAVISKPVTCEETKCNYRGDEHHEFLLKW